jgi:hypothetical protein
MLTQKYQSQFIRVDSIIVKMTKGEIQQYNYVFVNALDNEHNQTKQKIAGQDGSIVLEQTN